MSIRVCRIPDGGTMPKDEKDLQVENNELKQKIKTLEEINTQMALTLRHYEELLNALSSVKGEES